MHNCGSTAMVAFGGTTSRHVSDAICCIVLLQCVFPAILYTAHLLAQDACTVDLNFFTADDVSGKTSCDPHFERTASVSQAQQA